MSRTPIVLSLVGLMLFLFGLYMMLRVIIPPELEGGGMSDQPGMQAACDTLRHEAVPGVFGTYVGLTASGLVMFASGLAMLLGRYRQQ